MYLIQKGNLDFVQILLLIRLICHFFYVLELPILIQTQRNDQAITDNNN